MKRTLAITLTVAMIGGLMFMGFAGTAAAQDTNVNVGDIDFGDQETGDAVAISDVDVEQNNANAQVGTASADADASANADDDDHNKNGGSAAALASADATSIVNQYQDVDQSNTADVSVTTYAESGDNVQSIFG